MSSIEHPDRSPIFADNHNVDGERFDTPTRDDFESLAAKLRRGECCSFSMERNRDRDSVLEVNWSGRLFSICGCEDSRERGNFAFCLLDSRNGDEPVEIEIATVPKYSTTSSVEAVIAIARTYFESGDLDRSVTWHVSMNRVFGPLAEVPSREVLKAGDVEDSLSRHVAR